MDTRSIKIFKHLATSLHFGKTSRAFHMTPSTLTRLVQRLEEEVGRKLFHRNRRSVSLTSAGQIFREYAEEAEQRWNELQYKLAADLELSGNLSLYCSVTAAHGILPDILSVFKANYHGVQIHLQTGDAAMAIPKLLSNEADIIIAALPEQVPATIESVALMQTPLVFIAPVNHPEIIIQKDGVIDWYSTPIILAEKGLSRVHLDKWFKEQGIHPHVYAQVAGNEALLAMVSLGCGVGVVPQLVLEKSLIRHEVQILKRAPQLTPFTIGVCTMKKNMSNPLMQAFWETVKMHEDKIG